jgi:hypothetical protein
MTQLLRHPTGRSTVLQYRTSKHLIEIIMRSRMQKLREPTLITCI